MAGWLHPNCWFKLSRELDSYLDLTPVWISWLICKPLPVKEAAFVCEEGGDDLWSCYRSSHSQWPYQPGHEALSVTFHLPRLWLLPTTCSHHWLPSHGPREMPVCGGVQSPSRVWLLCFSYYVTKPVHCVLCLISIYFCQWCLIRSASIFTLSCAASVLHFMIFIGNHICPVYFRLGQGEKYIASALIILVTLWLDHSG